MPYLTLKTVTAMNVNGDSFTHPEGTVVSDWEVSDFIRSKITEGSAHYRSLFEPLTDEEALRHRVRATVAEGDHYADGEAVSPPWEDYVGLHPEEIVGRLRDAKTLAEVTTVRAYERGGMNRSIIIDYVAPVERAPFTGYDEMQTREILSKLEVLSDADVADVIRYESANRRRPAIITYERPMDDHTVNTEATVAV